jgi:hypothetical protein
MTPSCRSAAWHRDAEPRLALRLASNEVLDDQQKNKWVLGASFAS